MLKKSKKDDFENQINNDTKNVDLSLYNTNLSIFYRLVKIHQQAALFLLFSSYSFMVTIAAFWQRFSIAALAYFLASLKNEQFVLLYWIFN